MRAGKRILGLSAGMAPSSAITVTMKGPQPAEAHGSPRPRAATGARVALPGVEGAARSQASLRW